MKTISQRKINTNNAWGFGGIIGTATIYDNGLSHIKGHRYYRHTGTSYVNEWYAEVDTEFEISIPRKPASKVELYKDGHYYTAIVDDRYYSNYAGSSAKDIKSRYQHVKTILIK